MVANRTHEKRIKTVPAETQCDETKNENKKSNIYSCILWDSKTFGWMPCQRRTQSASKLCAPKTDFCFYRFGSCASCVTAMWWASTLRTAIRRLIKVKGDVDYDDDWKWYRCIQSIWLSVQKLAPRTQTHTLIRAHLWNQTPNTNKHRLLIFG